MKEFEKNNTVNYNLMSFTGYKSLVVFTLLLEKPISIDEINDYIMNNSHNKSIMSLDTLRVYITSLKKVGCKVKQKKIDGVSKYFIASHPFNLSISQTQINNMIKVYKNITKSLSIQELISLDNFYNKIAELTHNNTFKEKFQSISIFKNTSIQLVQQLFEICENKEQILISYNSPQSGIADIELITDKLDYVNNKIYIYGIGLKYMQYAYFQVSRIIEIKSIKKVKTIPIKMKTFKIGYELNIKNCEIELDEQEKIIQQNKDTVIIEATTTNDFWIKQKILSYGADCKIIYPESFKQEFIKTLEEMKKEYF
ncbi:MAG: WYL domain-containing protein [Candidatus Gastranaerophilales bacterium]